MKSNKSNLIGTENINKGGYQRLGRLARDKEWEDVDQSGMVQLDWRNKFDDLLHYMVTTIDDSVLYIPKLLKV